MNIVQKSEKILHTITIRSGPEEARKDDSLWLEDRSERRVTQIAWCEHGYDNRVEIEFDWNLQSMKYAQMKLDEAFEAADCSKHPEEDVEIPVREVTVTP